MENLRKVTLYSSTLAVPGRRDWEDQIVLKGKKIFNQLNCTCRFFKLSLMDTLNTFGLHYWQA
jgi:CxxC motif-containing protein (DUF1111 family)